MSAFQSNRFQRKGAKVQRRQGERCASLPRRLLCWLVWRPLAFSFRNVQFCSVLDCGDG